MELANTDSKPETGSSVVAEQEKDSSDTPSAQTSDSEASPPKSVESEVKEDSDGFDAKQPDSSPPTVEPTPTEPTREEPGKSAIVQKPAAPLKRPEPQQSEVRPTEMERYTEDELEWVASLVSLQTALLRRRLGEDESLRCTEQLQDRGYEETTAQRSPDSSTVSGVSFSGRVASENQLVELLQDYLITHSEVENLDPVVLKYLAAKQIQRILPTRYSDIIERLIDRLIG